MDKLGRLLPGVLAAQPESGRIRAIQARLEINAIVGTAMAAHCLDVDVVGSTCTVITDSAALAHQMTLEASRILERLNAALGGRRVRNLKVRIGRGG